MFFPCPEWENDETCIYLGSEENPRTKRQYDYWLIRTHESDSEPFNWSSTCRHGTEPGDYGSQGLFLAHYDSTGYPHAEDFIFGIERAKILSLYYLAFKNKPLLEEEN